MGRITWAEGSCKSICHIYPSHAGTGSHLLADINTLQLKFRRPTTSTEEVQLFSSPEDVNTNAIDPLQRMKNNIHKLYNRNIFLNQPSHLDYKNFLIYIFKLIILNMISFQIHIQIFNTFQ